MTSCFPVAALTSLWKFCHAFRSKLFVREKVCVWESRNAAAEFVSSNSWTFKKELDCPVRQELFPLLSFSFCSSLLTRCGKFRFLTDWVSKTLRNSLVLLLLTVLFCAKHALRQCGWFQVSARFWSANSDDRSFFSIKSYEFADTQSQFFVTKELGKCFCLGLRRERLQKKFLNLFRQENNCYWSSPR